MLYFISYFGIVLLQCCIEVKRKFIKIMKNDDFEVIEHNVLNFKKIIIILQHKSLGAFLIEGVMNSNNIKIFSEAVEYL